MPEKERIEIPNLKPQNKRFTHKGELVQDNSPDATNLTGDNRRKNPYKTPPNSLTSKDHDALEEKE